MFETKHILYHVCDASACCFGLTCTAVLWESRRRGIHRRCRTCLQGSHHINRNGTLYVGQRSIQIVWIWLAFINEGHHSGMEGENVNSVQRSKNSQQRTHRSSAKEVAQIAKEPGHVGNWTMVTMRIRWVSPCLCQRSHPTVTVRCRWGCRWGSGLSRSVD